MRNFVIGLVLLVAGAGCAPATIQGLRDNHGGRYEFIANENYQSVYRKVLYQARNCHQAGGIGAQWVVQGDLFHDLKSGNVTFALHGVLSVSTILTVDVSALDDKTTNVIVYYVYSTWGSAARAVREWVLENSTECTSKRE